MTEGVITADGVLATAILHVLVELCVERGLDPDGSLTIERVLAAMGQWEQLALDPAEPHAPWAASNRAAVQAARSRLASGRSLMSRLVLAGRALREA